MPFVPARRSAAKDIAVRRKLGGHPAVAFELRKEEVRLGPARQATRRAQGHTRTPRLGTQN